MRLPVGEHVNDKVAEKLTICGIYQRWAALAQSQHHDIDSRGRHEIGTSEPMHDF